MRRYREHGLARAGGSELPSGTLAAPNRSCLVGTIVALRRLRYTGLPIARALGLSRATVSRILRRSGLNRLRSLDPPPPVARYEHPPATSSKRLPGSSSTVIASTATAPARLAAPATMVASACCSTNSTSNIASPGHTPRAQWKTGVPGKRLCLLGWKAERYIQTALREWAYARTYQKSAERTAQLEAWIQDYNFHPC